MLIIYISGLRAYLLGRIMQLEPVAIFWPCESRHRACLVSSWDGESLLLP